jgi:hypothetical protein
MEDVEKQVIPFETNRIPYGDKPQGYEEVIEDGVDGVRIITRVDGQIVSDKTTHPKNKVIYFGTAEITSEAPQEESPEQPTLNTEVDTLSPLVPTTPNPVQPQGRDTEDGVLNKETTVNTKVFKKALLEAARLLVFAVPGILITVLTDNPSLGGSLGGTILLVLKSIDRSIHENPATPVKGLLPF